MRVPRPAARMSAFIWLLLYRGRLKRAAEESTCEVQTENPSEITPQCSQRQENGQAAEDGEEQEVMNQNAFLHEDVNLAHYARHRFAESLSSSWLIFPAYSSGRSGVATRRCPAITNTDRTHPPIKPRRSSTLAAASAGATSTNSNTKNRLMPRVCLR